MAAIVFEIYRFDPEKDNEPHYKKYAVEVGPSTTVSQVLRKIKDKADGTLTFRKGCGCAICGTCAVRIDGKARLACKTKIQDLVDDLETSMRDGDLVRIDPLTTQNVIKDLVIDETIFWEQLKKTMPWLNDGKDGSGNDGLEKTATEINDMTQSQLEALDDSQNCIHCHACTSSCDTASVDPEFLGPEALTKVYRFVKDPRDVATYERLKIATDGNMWNCVRSFTCIDECPKDIRPADKISELHELAVDNGITNRGSRHAEHFVHSLRKTGKLDEKMMPLRTLRAGVIGFVPDTIKMISKGKIPSLFIRKIEDHKELWHLIEIAKDRKEEREERR